MPGRRKKTPVYENRNAPRPSWVDFFRLDESYTSLILGIIVVIIGSILLVSFVKNKNTTNLHKEVTSASIAPSQIYNVPLTLSPTPTVIPSISLSPSPTSTPPSPTQTIATPTSHPSFSPSPSPTTLPSSTPTLTPTPTRQPSTAIGSTYIVKHGDDLWNIAQQKYGSGYNWVDIARANNLDNPGLLYAGMKLIMPNVAPKTTTNTNNVQSQNPLPITTMTYTVQKDDTLWSIAVRAYNDGYQWTKIAQANHLANPSVIHSGNVLTIPR